MMHKHTCAPVTSTKVIKPLSFRVFMEMENMKSMRPEYEDKKRQQMQADGHLISEESNLE